MARLLVVDDDQRVRELLSRLLAREGHVLACAGSGDEALAALGQSDSPPDLVILDWMMPGLDGAAVLRQMRANPATAAVRVMVYTAADDPDVERQAIRLGALDCVPKVGRFADLRERIVCCLNAGRTAPSPRVAPSGNSAASGNGAAAAGRPDAAGEAP